MWMAFFILVGLWVLANIKPRRHVRPKEFKGFWGCIKHDWKRKYGSEEVW